MSTPWKISSYWPRKVQNYNLRSCEAKANINYQLLIRSVFRHIGKKVIYMVFF